MQTQKVSVNITSQHLTDAQKEEMWNVYRRYYSASKTSFMMRIPEHNLFSLELDDGKIVSFKGLCTQDLGLGLKSSSPNLLYTPELA